MSAMTETTRARIAVIGAGLIGREHVALLRRHPGAELAAIADVTPEGEALARECGVACHADYRRMLREVPLDGAIIALPNQLHLEAGLACIEHGVAMLMEKPVADTLASALALAQAVEAGGVPLLVGHQRRHSPDIVAAHRAITQGELGPLVTVNGMWWMHKNERYFDAEWRRRPGGGPLLINLIHDIDCLRFLCGEVETVQASVSSHARGFAVEDTAAVILRFANGALGTFSLSDAVPSPYTWDGSSGQALYFPSQRENCYFIGGRRASLAVPTLARWQHEGEGRWQDPLVCHQVQREVASAYERQLTHFLAVAARRAPPVVSARDGMRTLATIHAIQQAAASGAPVRVDEVIAEASGEVA